MFEKITQLKAEKKLLLAASQQSLNTDSGIENEGDTKFEMRSISRESRKVDQRPRCLKRMKMKKRATRALMLIPIRRAMGMANRPYRRKKKIRRMSEESPVQLKDHSQAANSLVQRRSLCPRRG